jgi:GT2 family glycosyltransferase
MRKSDVIIPIYNAYDCLKLCIDSVIENTNLNENRIILIDDESTDERVLPLLEKYNKINKSIILLTNEKNLGFVKTVNRGMKYSKKNDVLLLNSDTEVTPKWLEKIKKCAYSEKMCATVTPLSNNATLASVPNGLCKNDLPSNMSLSDYSNLIECSSDNKTVSIPTAHGFCMYIRRDALNIVGYFDEKSFGTGYGEENDFSYRCMDYGFKNLLCTNTIIYHKESQSFSNKREEVISSHSNILLERYPRYVNLLGIWLKNFPIKNYCLNIEYEILLHNKINILILIHDWSNINENVGGTTLHVKDLIMALRDKYNFHVLYPSGNCYKLTSYFEDGKEETMDFVRPYEFSKISFYNNEYEELIEKIIVGLRINVLHIHHMINHYFNIIDVAKKHNVYSIISLHDFYCICPSINLLYNQKDYCLNLEKKDCQQCLYSYSKSIYNNIIPNWHIQWDLFLNQFDKIICPSYSSKAIITQIYPKLKIQVIEHGTDLKKSKYYPTIKNDDFNIAFIGAVAPHKGEKLISDLISHNKNNKFHYHLFGTTDNKLLIKNKKNYTYHGKYSRTDLPKLLENSNINLVCLLSICPETYSYTLSETCASGIPSLAFNIGAIGERIEKYELGYVIDLTNNYKDIYEKIEHIYNEKDKYDKIINNLKNYDIKTTIEMAKEYNDFYKNQKTISISNESGKTLLNLINSKFSLNYNNDDSMELNAIKNSYRWKLVSKIKVPRIISKLIRKR